MFRTTDSFRSGQGEPQPVCCLVVGWSSTFDLGVCNPRPTASDKHRLLRAPCKRMPSKHAGTPDCSLHMCLARLAQEPASEAVLIQLA